MASVCACSDYFTVNDDGELCLIPGRQGLRQIIKFTDPGADQFEIADYPWAARIRVKVQAAGGGSAGANADTGTAVVRPGGAGGGYSESAMIAVSALGAVETVVVGAGGSGGSGNSAGTAGGNSAFGGLVTANGGDGSPANMPSGTEPSTANGVAGPFAGVGFIALGGGAGGSAIRLNEDYGVAGSGGDSFLGTGGLGRSGDGPGLGPRGFGGGAGGSTSLGGDSNAGGDGGGGIVIVEIYG